MVKITVYNLTPVAYRTLELLNIMVDRMPDYDYFILYTQEVDRPYNKRKHHIGADSEVAFSDNIMNIINPHSCSVINLNEEQGYQIEGKRI